MNRNVSTADAEPMRFFVSKANAFKLALLVLAMIGASVACGCLPGIAPTIVGWIGVAFFGACFVVILSRFWHRGVAVEISLDSISDFRSGLRGCLKSKSTSSQPSEVVVPDLIRDPGR